MRNDTKNERALRGGITGLQLGLHFHTTVYIQSFQCMHDPPTLINFDFEVLPAPAGAHETEAARSTFGRESVIRYTLTAVDRMRPRRSKVFCILETPFFLAFSHFRNAALTPPVKPISQ